MENGQSILPVILQIIGILVGVISPVAMAYVLLKKLPAETKATEATTEEIQVSTASNAVETFQRFATLYDETFKKLLARDNELANLNAEVIGLKFAYSSLESKFALTESNLNAERTLRRQAESERDNLSLEVDKLRRRVEELERQIHIDEIK